MDTSIFENQLNDVLESFVAMQGKSRHNDLSDLPKADRQSLVMRGIAAIHRISGSNSTYVTEINRIQKEQPLLHVHTSSIMGIVKGLRDDIKQDYIQTLVELVHSEVFSDFLDMSQHLLTAGYKDAAAVIAGSTLEGHLRKICYKNSISVEEVKKDGSVFSKKADRLNADLAKSNAYSKLDQKNITAWLGLRNKAAHGNYNEYTEEQVTLLLASIRDFITRIPA